MEYEDWLKSVRLDAKFRESLENSKKLVYQVKRFTSFVISDLTTQVRKGRNIDDIIKDLQSGFGIPKSRIKEFSAFIKDELNRYSEFRSTSGRDLGLTLSDSEFQRINAILNYETTIQQQAALDAVKTLQKAQQTPSIQRVLANGSGVNQIENLLRSGGMQYHAITEARLALQQFNSRYTYSVADQAQINIFEYYGPSDEKNRALCAALVGLWFTKDQLSNMDNGLGYSVLHYCGGPNCRHEPLPVPQQFQNQFPEKLSGNLELVQFAQDSKRPFSIFVTEENKQKLELELN